ncbi:CRISPR-associated helicase/endonuclease Cas3 [soil metagenome]
MTYYAHTAKDADGNPVGVEAWQPLSTHLLNVARLAREFARPLRLEAEAEIAGLLHDLGKYSRRFQARLHDNSIRGINHWSAGASVAFQHRALEAAFAIEGHHTGMPAFLNNDDEPGAGTGLECLKQRLLKLRDPKLALEVNGFSESTFDLLNLFGSEKFTIPERREPSAAETDFARALRTRMLFSCLVDADFLDTEAHFDATKAGLRSVPELTPDRALEVLRADLANRPSEGAINELRGRLLADCLLAAEESPGLFSLTAPTGSGKTLASLAFALRHAAVNNARLAKDDPNIFRRVIVVIPYTSIIEQTAQVYRELFEPLFGPHYLLEHHSAVGPRERKEDAGHDAEEDRLRRARLAQENWDAPLVVTTSVQFFESLFGHKPSQCRKLHNIGRSVVLFDEVQTLPLKLVPSLLSAVNLLVKDYGVTAVFGTATQPAFASAASAIPEGWRPREISSQPRAMAEALRRTRITRRSDDQRTTWAGLAAELGGHPQVLCVVNLKRHARELFTALKVAESQGPAFHLSASMCPAHRQVKLAEVRRRLLAGEPCRLISTQLIEAGVDVDFPRVYRAMGPLDSIIQTAGRCNREGRMSEAGDVIVFRPEDDGKPPGAYAQAAAVTEAFLTENPDADLHQPETYAAYFARLYGTLGPQAAKDDPAFAFSERLDFPAAARACRLVGEDTRSVVVRWGEGERLAKLIRYQKYLSRDEWRLAQRFAVNFYQSEFNASVARGEIVQPVPDFDFYFWNGHYDEDLGVVAPSLNDFNL